MLNDVLAQVAEATGIGLFSACQPDGSLGPGGCAGADVHRRPTGCTTTIVAMPAWPSALADAILDGLRETRALSARR